MKYDPTRDGLYRPYTRPPLDPGLFARKRDALCAELSRLAYLPFPPRITSLSQGLANLGLSDVFYFEDATTNTQAFAGLDASATAFAVFRGTESEGTMDLITDAMFLRRSWDRGGKVHHGFANAYDSHGSVSAHDSLGRPVPAYHGQGLNMRAALRKWLGNVGHKSLVATGHSLGAALATLFASDYPEADLITIGSPTVGNAAFVATVDGVSRSIRRYRDCCDVVTRVPPTCIGFRHTRGEIYIDRNGALHDPAPGTFEILADRAEGALQYLPLAAGSLSNVKVRDLADHAPVNYVSAILGIREPI